MAKTKTKTKHKITATEGGTYYILRSTEIPDLFKPGITGDFKQRLKNHGGEELWEVVETADLGSGRAFAFEQRVLRSFKRLNAAGEYLKLDEGQLAELQEMLSEERERVAAELSAKAEALLEDTAKRRKAREEKEAALEAIRQEKQRLARSIAEKETKLAKLEAEAKAEAEAMARAKAKAEAEARAKARAEAEARRCPARAKAEAEARAKARAKAEAEARAEREAVLKQLEPVMAEARARARAKAEAEARAKAEAKAKARLEELKEEGLARELRKGYTAERLDTLRALEDKIASCLRATGASEKLVHYIHKMVGATGRPYREGVTHTFTTGELEIRQHLASIGGFSLGVCYDNYWASLQLRTLLLELVKVFARGERSFFEALERYASGDWARSTAALAQALETELEAGRKAVQAGKREKLGPLKFLIPAA